MTSTEETYRQLFVAVLRDVQESGRHDAEAVWLTGSLAAALIEERGQRTWPSMRAALRREDYDGLLAGFQKQGKALAEKGKGKQLWAVQLLAVSLVARTQTDPGLREGVALLDGFIATAIAYYRKNRHLGTGPASA